MTYTATLSSTLNILQVLDKKILEKQIQFRKMNLTTAISIVNDGVLVGPNKGCPVLYIRDEDNPDQFQALNTKEFYEYLKKQRIFRDVSSYCKTAFYLSWFYIDDNGEVKTDSASITLQEAYPLSKLQYDDTVHDMYVWNILYVITYNEAYIPRKV